MTERILKALENEPEADACAALKRVLRKRYNESLYLTAKDLLGYKEMKRTTHQTMVSELEARTERKLIVMPRGTFKSSIGAVAYPIWLLNNNPNLRILLDSEVYTNSKNFLREIKAHLCQPKMVELFGEYESAPWNEGEITIKQRTRNFKEASITCGGIGTIKVGQHYDVIISDDLNSNNNSQTQEGRQKVIDHFRYNMAILDPGGIYVVIGTRYAADDIIGWILLNELGIKNGARIGL